MPSLEEYECNNSIKLLLCADSGTGKTGCLASLADAGFNLRIIDLDEGLPILKNVLRHPKFGYSPDAIKRVRAVTLTEPMRQIGGRVVPKTAKVWNDMVRLLDKWKEPDGTDLGGIQSWGPEDVLVIDSLTRAGKAAFNFQMQVNGKLGQDIPQNEWRRTVGHAQQHVENLLEMLYDRSVRCNVVVISHIIYNNADGLKPDPEKNDEKQGLPSAIGRALSPKIPTFFNDFLTLRIIGAGPAAKRVLQTESFGNLNLKSRAPGNVRKEYPLKTGLADYFADVRKAEDLVV